MHGGSVKEATSLYPLPSAFLGHPHTNTTPRPLAAGRQPGVQRHTAAAQEEHQDLSPPKAVVRHHHQEDAPSPLSFDLLLQFAMHKRNENAATLPLPRYASTAGSSVQRHLLNFSHGGSPELAPLTGLMTTTRTILPAAQPRCSTVLRDALDILAPCSQRSRLSSGQTSTSQVGCLQASERALPAHQHSSSVRRLDKRERRCSSQSFLPPATHLPKCKIVSGLMAPSRWT